MYCVRCESEEWDGIPWHPDYLCKRGCDSLCIQCCEHNTSIMDEPMVVTPVDTDLKKRYTAEIEDHLDLIEVNMAEIRKKLKLIQEN